jgi:hypothetical protein
MGLACSMALSIPAGRAAPAGGAPRMVQRGRTSAPGQQHVHHQAVEPPDEGRRVVELTALGQLRLVEQDQRQDGGPDVDSSPDNCR